MDNCDLEFVLNNVTISCARSSFEIVINISTLTLDAETLMLNVFISTFDKNRITFFSNLLILNVSIVPSTINITLTAPTDCVFESFGIGGSGITGSWDGDGFDGDDAGTYGEINGCRENKGCEG